MIARLQILSVILGYWLLRPFGREFATRTMKAFIAEGVRREYDKLFWDILRYRSLGTVRRCYLAIWAGPGKSQKISVLEDANSRFAFLCYRCLFWDWLRRGGCGHLASAMCEADRGFWIMALAGSDIRCVKSQTNLATGADQCYQSFEARK